MKFVHCIWFLAVAIFVTSCRSNDQGLLWKITMTSRPYADPVIDRDRLYVASQSGEVIAATLRDGKRIWNQKLSGSVIGTPVISNGMLYVATREGALYCLNSQTGATQWRVTIEDQFISPATLYSGGILFPSENGTLYSVSPLDGTILWKVSGQRKFNTRALINGKNILIGSWAKNFLCLKPDGSLNWKLVVAEPVTEDPIVSNNTVFFAAHDEFVYAVDIPSGRLLWRADAEKPSNPVLFDHELIFASGNSISVVSANSGQHLRNINFGKIIYRLYRNNKNLFVVSRDVYNVNPFNGDVSRTIQLPKPVYKLTFDPGMIIASDELYSIYGYAARHE